MTRPAPHVASPLALALLAATATLTSCERRDAAAPDPNRGRYLVESVGLCIDCHSPRDDKGQWIRERWLEGSPLPFAPTVEMPWAAAAPPIAGLPQLSDEEALRFFTTGVLPHGRVARPPMPTYRLSPQDARDVVAYLRGLGPRAGTGD